MKIMKKLILSLIACAVLVSSFAGCGYDPLVDGAKTTTAATEDATAETQAETEKEYKNNYNGIEAYMADKGYINEVKNKDSDRTEMQADLIGAEKGYRYTKNTANIELYYFDTKNLSDTAKENIDSVNKDGYFTIYDKKIEAYISDNSEFMMIYIDSAVTGDKESEAYKTKQQAIEDFKKFGE